MLMSDVSGKPAGPQANNPLDRVVKQQARRRVNRAVATGRLEHPSSVPCVDCGDLASGRRHEYDHHAGYEHPLMVEAVCSACHCERSLSRGERERSRERRTGPPIGRLRGVQMPRQPFPEGETYTVRAVALRFHRSPKRIYNLLWARARDFSAPQYFQVYLGRGDRRLYRVLTEFDMQVFRTIFPTRVK